MILWVNNTIREGYLQDKYLSGSG